MLSVSLSVILAFAEFGWVAFQPYLEVQWLTGLPCWAVGCLARLCSEWNRQGPRAIYYMLQAQDGRRPLLAASILAFKVSP